MLDRDRVLAKLDELDGYLVELRSVTPESFEQYGETRTRRSCERLLQMCVETVIDTCALLVSGLRLGLPGEQEDLFDKLTRRGVVSQEMAATLGQMKGLRNILVHEYGRVDDELVFETVRHHLSDFEAFRREIGTFLGGGSSP